MCHLAAYTFVSVMFPPVWTITGDTTQGLAYAKQMLYHGTSPHAFIIFQCGVKPV